MKAIRVAFLILADGLGTLELTQLRFRICHGERSKAISAISRLDLLQKYWIILICPRMNTDELR